MGHEMVTAVLPMFLATLGGSAASLGLIEGIADAGSSFVKLWMGYYSDRIGKRKPIMIVGYAMTAFKGIMAFAFAWPQVLAIRTLAWMGRGARGPVRDALMADIVEPPAYGRAFGFHSAMDTIGAVIGPLVALSLIGLISYRQIFLITFIPGILSVVCVVFLVKERANVPNHHLRLWKSIKTLPPNFKLFLISAGIFGLGNFAHTLLILRAMEILTPHYGATTAAATSVALYTLHNIFYAALSYPVGVLSERLGKRRLLGLGYLLFAMMCIGFMLEPHKLWVLVLLFSMAGIYMALIDSMERALAGDLLPDDLRGTGYGVLATVNAVGDFVSSFMVGLLWTAVSPQAGFLYGAVLSLASWAVLNRFRKVLH